MTTAARGRGCGIARSADALIRMLRVEGNPDARGDGGDARVIFRRPATAGPSPGPLPSRLSASPTPGPIPAPVPRFAAASSRKRSSTASELAHIFRQGLSDPGYPSHPESQMGYIGGTASQINAAPCEKQGAAIDTPDGTRTRVTRMRTWHPRPLDDGGICRFEPLKAAGKQWPRGPQATRAS
jgi:hypothetical protein